MRELPQPSGALAEMLAASGELDRILDGRGLLFDDPPPPPVVPPEPFIIPPPDWDEEERERLALEREQEQRERDRIVQEELAKLEDKASQQPPPAPPRWRRRP